MIKSFACKRVGLCIVLLLLFVSSLLSQTTEIPPATSEQQLENATENNADAEPEDDSYQQQMAQYNKHPINLNTASADELQDLKILTPLQIQNCISYRNVMGKFISIYELQAIPGWTINIIEKIRIYITVNNAETVEEALKIRLKGGTHTLFVRVSQTLQRSKGYLNDSVTNFYPGSPQKILLRYQYQYKNILQYGITAEKDAGEQFFKGSQKQGFDFYSAHFFAKNIGIIKAIALGDFTVNLGQGLIQWQSQAFKKSAEVLNTKRESLVLRPYTSAGEYNFHRGGGITIKKKHWETTLFISYRKLDANTVTDSSQNTADYISSLQISGYHRTKSETDDKGVQGQLAVGGNLAYNSGLLHLGINAIHYQFKLPIKKDAQPYNIYALSGSALSNYSIDYSYTFKNLHWFGEMATSSNLHVAFVNGLLISLASSADMSLVYRNISPGYQSLYTNAFTENTYPVNEKGMYTGLSLRPADQWRVDMYADVFTFPWLKYRVNAVTAGKDYLFMVTYKPTKQLEISSHFKSASRALNYNPDVVTLQPVIQQPRQNWRTQFSYVVNAMITVKSRVESVWFHTNDEQTDRGFLTFFDIAYQPRLQPWSANVRLTYFETDSYNSRMYAFESDVLFNNSIPVFYNKGEKIYINLNLNANKKITLWFKLSQTVYLGQNLIGSGLDEIKGHQKTEIKLQAMYKF